ncbi:DUF1523 family protein [Rhizobium leguminosarum]|uniref:DUF1523 family protein n=1 Tax=Rhizobium leguminosarum TaxID=384 RepID=UPI002E1353C2|nr:DUF1523 family protein [Rhizobium leguminosarum]
MTDIDTTTAVETPRKPRGSWRAFAIRYTAAAIALIPAYMFVDYALPSYTLIHVSDTDTRRMDEDGNFIPKSQPTTGATRDVAFIYGKYAHVEKDAATGTEKVVVEEKRDWSSINEDTGWNFLPFPYFKFDTSDLQANAAYLKGSAAFAKTYGYRFQFWSWFPNTLELVKWEPGMWILNWLRILGMTFFAIAVAGAWFVCHTIRRWVMGRIDAAAEAARIRAEAIGDQMGAVGESIDAFGNSDGVQTAKRRFWKIFGDWI